MISVCKNASHYHSVCDPFCGEEAKFRAQKKILFFDRHSLTQHPPFISTSFSLRVIQKQKHRNAVKLPWYKLCLH